MGLYLLCFSLHCIKVYSPKSGGGLQVTRVMTRSALMTGCCLQRTTATMTRGPTVATMTTAPCITAADSGGLPARVTAALVM